MKTNLFQSIISDNIFLGLNQIDRWDRKRTIKVETVGGHSHDVTIIVRALVEEIFPTNAYEQKLEIVTDASMHDFDEVFSGDLNHDVKYNDINGDEIRRVLSEFCNARLRQYFSDNTNKSSVMFLKSTTDKSQYSKDLIKVADWISMAIFCKREISLGNTTFKDTFSHCIRSLNVACDKSIESLNELYKNSNDFEYIDTQALQDIKDLIW